MSHTPHELAEEFPDKIEAMQALKEHDKHFAKLYADYHKLNRDIHRAETDVAPTDDLHINAMRKARLALKDQVAAALRAT